MTMLTHVINYDNVSSTVNSISIPESIPFEMVDGLMILKVPNGNSIDNFLFDTGAEHIIINDEVTKGSFKVIGVDHTLEAREIKIERLNLGASSLHHIDAWALDLNFLEDQLKVELKGVIGAQLLRDHSVLIDQEQSTITFVDHSYNKYSLNKQYNVISLDFEQDKDDLPVVKVLVEGKELHLGFDTGANVCVFDSKLAYSMSDSYDPGTDNRLLKNMRIQNCDIKDVPYIIKNLEDINANRVQKIDGIISTNSLATKKIFIDSRRKKIFLLYDRVLS